MREKLIEMLNKSFEEQSAKRGILAAPHTADYLIANGVTIDPASLRPKGEWEWFEEWNPSTTEHPAECEECGWRCGNCKRALEDMVGGYWDDPYEKPRLDFCPNCGADMRGGNDAP